MENTKCKMQNAHIINNIKYSLVSRTRASESDTLM